MIRGTMTRSLLLALLLQPGSPAWAQNAAGNPIVNDVQTKMAECRNNFGISPEFAACAQTCFRSLQTLASLKGAAMDAPWTQCVAAHTAAVRSGLGVSNSAPEAPATQAVPAAGTASPANGQGASTSLQQKIQSGLQEAAAMGVPESIQKMATDQMHFCEQGVQAQAPYECDCLQEKYVEDWQNLRDENLVQFYRTVWSRERRKIDQMRQIGTNQAVVDGMERQLTNSEQFAMQGAQLHPPLSSSCLSRDRTVSYALQQCEYGNAPYGYPGTKAEYCGCYSKSYADFVLDNGSTGMSFSHAKSDRYATLECRP